MLTMGRALRVLIIAMAVPLLLLTATTASATFPGRNGEIVVSSWPYPVESLAFHFSLTFVDPRTGQARRQGLCTASSGGYGGPCEGGGAAAVSPDGQRIAFITADGDATDTHAPIRYQLSLLPYGGGPAVKHSVIGRPQDPAFLYYTDLAWSPDGSRLVLQGSGEVGPPQLTFLRTDGRLTGRIIKNASDPDWSADGRLVFARNGGLFAGKPSGAFRLVTRKGGTMPSWSPDGRRIAFVRKGGIYVVASRGGRPRRLAKHGPPVDTFGGPPAPGYVLSEPAWSPDGKQLVFMRDFHRMQNSYLYALNAKTKRLRRVYTAIQPSDQVFSLDWRALPRVER
jgi:dipeptidyl aminopeptidase/acylaminoacyl peptidase